jgi:phosphoribosylglycinamide formyltransferase-1
VRLGVLASGTGTILEAILSEGIDVALVIVDRSCRAVDVATDHGVKAEVVERSQWGDQFDRVAFSRMVADCLRAHEIDVVAMAGYGTVLAQPVFDAYAGRILNTHPSLLPAFPGWHSVGEALEHGVKLTGCTVHIATVDVDAGPILAQQAVEVRPDDTVESLHERIKAVERTLYPATIRSFVHQLETST